MTNIETAKAAFKSFELAASWALEAVDNGRLDCSELYDFIRDLRDGKDMNVWLKEDAARSGLNGTVC
jgi:hypothetical protein